MARKASPNPARRGSPEKRLPAAVSRPHMEARAPAMLAEGAAFGTTGRQIVIFKEGVLKEPKLVPQALNRLAGISEVVAFRDDNGGGATNEALDAGAAVHFHKLGIAVVSDGEVFTRLAAAALDADSPIAAIEPEYIAQLSPALH